MKIPADASGLRRRVNVGLIATMLVGVGFAFWPYYSAGREARAFCESLTPGLSLAQVQARSAENGFELFKLEDGRIFAEDKGSFGRRLCALRFEAPGLAASSYVTSY